MNEQETILRWMEDSLFAYTKMFGRIVTLPDFKFEGVDLDNYPFLTVEVLAVCKRESVDIASIRRCADAIQRWINDPALKPNKAQFEADWTAACQSLQLLSVNEQAAATQSAGQWQGVGEAASKAKMLTASEFAKSRDTTERSVHRAHKSGKIPEADDSTGKLLIPEDAKWTPDKSKSRTAAAKPVTTPCSEGDPNKYQCSECKRTYRERVKPCSKPGCNGVILLRETIEGQDL